MFCELIHTYFAIFLKGTVTRAVRHRAICFHTYYMGGLNKLYKIQIIIKYALRTGL